MDNGGYYNAAGNRFQFYALTSGIITAISTLGFVMSLTAYPIEWVIHVLNPFSFLLFIVFFASATLLSWLAGRYFHKCGKVLELFHQWENETRHLSQQRDFHPLIEEIISYGKIAINPLLVELNKRPCHVFAPLTRITGVHPVPKEYSGNIPMMRKYWLAWGKENGYL